MDLHNKLGTLPRCKSLSARRAWIEILASGINPDQSTVALRKESVDRNGNFGLAILISSLVALRKESVDRNIGAF